MEKSEMKTKNRGGRIMTLAKAMTLTSKEYAELDERYGGFDQEAYFNHQAHNREETLYDFIEKGSGRIKNIRLLKHTD